MPRVEMLRRIGALAGILGIILVIYALWARPYQLHWGANAEEIRRSMPGDELNPKPDFLATRAITIEGTPGQIWPWLIQMGYGRGGFYAYDVFDNLGYPSADRILPQYQDFKLGDAVPISPARNMVFYAIDPNSHLVWSGGAGHGGIAWGLYPIDATHTRLVSRFRWSYRLGQPLMLPVDIFTEFTDQLAIRKTLQGVKDRVEDHIQPPGDANIEFFLYVGAAIVFAYAAVSVLRLPLTSGSWLTGLAGGLAWLITWYAPVSIWIGAVLCFLIIWAVRVEFRDLRRARIKAMEAQTSGARKNR